MTTNLHKAISTPSSSIGKASVTSSSVGPSVQILVTGVISTCTGDVHEFRPGP